jgi:hypothetical protein
MDLGLAELGDVGGQGEFDFLAGPGPDRAQQVQHDHGDVVAVDIDADRQAAVGIDRQVHGRLAARALHPPGLQDQALVQQALGDVGHRRRRQAGDLGQGHAGDRAVDPDGLQDDPLIVVANPLKIGARQAGAGGALPVRFPRDFQGGHSATFDLIA